ncbi:Aminotransferase, class IV [Syntrophomonas zehnderi OL-4]|uniref:Aminotransferase, class IV n=1 Tax=Syntrophomonas zehnderi OL-4 TaxID=690567 RepID=A0A0E4C8P0_9FIRM|nr:aminotransferase class IV [Syntrophomonas zehnderi]CFX56742.1 Aminotransferase, class IV [Syntrophomonas zehnderi OL-4]
MEAIIERHFVKNDEILPATSFVSEIFNEGYSLYEVLKVISGVPLFMEEHINRLVASAARTNHELIQSPAKIKTHINDLIHACQTDTGNIKFVVNYPHETDKKADFYAFFIPYHYPSAADYSNGVVTITHNAERTNPHAKVINRAFTSKIKQIIEQHNAFEALLLDNNGFVTEGSRSNIFMVQENTVITAPLQNVLPGITRGCVIDLCEKLGLTVIERKIHLDELTHMEALFLTGTSPNVLPINKVDHLKFDSAAHPAVQKIMQAYDNLIQTYINNYLGK